MRISIVTGPFYPVPPAPCGAVERLWQNLAVVFASRGHEVTVLCRDYPGQIRDETLQGVRYIRRGRLNLTTNVKVNILKDALYSLRMLWKVPRSDIIVTNCFWLPMWLSRVRKHAGRVVVNVNRWPKGQMKLYRKVARLAAASGAVRDAIVAEFPPAEPLIEVLPNPIDTTHFVPPATPRPMGTGGTILYTGRIHPEKGVHLLVEAFARLHPAHPDIRLRIMGARTIAAGGGGDEYVGELQKRASGLPVEFLDPVYDRAALARELQAADLYCYPSVAETGESFGVAPLEAMGTGLAPIVSGLTVFRDFIEPGRNGLIFDHRAPDPAGALAAELKKLIVNPRMREEMGRAAHQTAQRFSTEQVASMYLHDFEKLLAMEPRS